MSMRTVKELDLSILVLVRPKISSEKDENPLPEGTIPIMLVGNQNCGKTTLFNQLTGSNQHVGNLVLLLT